MVSWGFVLLRDQEEEPSNTVTSNLNIFRATTGKEKKVLATPVQMRTVHMRKLWTLLLMTFLWMVLGEMKAEHSHRGNCYFGSCGDSQRSRNVPRGVLEPSDV